MKKILLTILSGVFACLNVVAQDFDKWFEPKSLRIDFALSGDTWHQSAALQQLREEPVWAGPRKNLIDRFGYGGYYINIYDKASGELIYSRGFNTLFEEWRTTGQAESEMQSWTNSISVPLPKSEVIAEITGRSREDMQMYPMMRISIDPASIFIDRGRLHENTVTQIVDNGPSPQKVDFVFLAEGYNAAEQDKFVADARRFADLLMNAAPYDTRRNDFNVWAVGLVSEDSGTDVAGKGVFCNTALNSGYYTFGTDRYLTTPDMKAVRDAVWNVPCDAIFILVNDSGYGGGGMYNFYAIGTSDNEKTTYLFLHELGHSFAGLADEYFSKDVAYSDFYNLGFEPWEPNITTLKDFGSKWKDLLPADTPVPTPLTPDNQNGIGVFEGGGYVSEGIYRPADHCMMRDYAPFCPACRRAILRMIDYLSDREY